MAKVTDVTKEYAEKAKGQDAQISYEDGYRQTKHKNEIHAAEWLMETFGGNITLLRENKEYGMKTPDFLWCGATWELKDISSDKYRTIDRRIQKACEQIRENLIQGKRGGIMLDFTESKLAMESIKQYVIQSAGTRTTRGTTDMIIKKGAQYAVLRIKRE